jgi:hypothetical protein
MVAERRPRSGLVPEANALDAGTGRAEVMTDRLRARIEASTICLNILSLCFSFAAIAITVAKYLR